MKVLTTAIGYNTKQVTPFVESLLEHGNHQIIAVCNDCEARTYLEYKGATIIEDSCTDYHPNVRRFMGYKEALRGVDEVVMLADIRDVIFQGDIDQLAGDNMQVYTENKRILDCPYNSKWMVDIGQHYDEQVICAGIIVGKLSEYVTLLWEALSVLPKGTTLDQALHNHFVYSGRVDATIHDYKYPVYTVGYVPYNQVDIADGLITVDGQVPIAVHQYDRHPVLLEGLRW